MGVLKSYPQETKVSYHNDANAGTKKDTIFVGNEQSKVTVSEFTQIYNIFNTEYDSVEQLINSLDKLLEPIYYNGPIADEANCKDKPLTGNTQINQLLATTAEAMHNVRIKLQAIVKSVNLI